MVKKLKSKRKKFFAGGYTMPSQQTNIKGFSLTMDQLTKFGNPVSKGFIGKKTTRKLT